MSNASGSHPRHLRTARFVCFLIGVTVPAFLTGFLCHRYRFPPYGLIVSVAQTLKHQAIEQGVDLFDREPGSDGTRFRPARDASGAELTPEQKDRIEALRSLGYAGATTVAPGRAGVTLHDPERAYAGYNLLNDGHAPFAALTDMAGALLHSWSLSFEAAFPGVEAPANADGTKYWRRVHLEPNGDLFAIYEGQGLVKIGPDSKVIWAYPGAAHHDLEVLDGGSVYVLTRQAEMLSHLNSREPILHDFITVLDGDGRERRSVSILRALEASPYAALLTRADKSGDIFHTNTLEVLDGRLAGRLPAFKAGNVLISLHKIHTVAVIDMSKEEITWAMSGLWIYQHQPTVLNNGNFLVFDNLGDGGRSRVVELDPLTQEVAWSYDGSQPAKSHNSKTLTVL